MEVKKDGKLQPENLVFKSVMQPLKAWVNLEVWNEVPHSKTQPPSINAKFSYLPNQPLLSSQNERMEVELCFRSVQLCTIHTAFAECNSGS